MASFLGYSKEDLEDMITDEDKNYETQITKFLAMFQMPDCGTRTMPIMHKLADFSGVAEVRRKTPRTPLPGQKGNDSLDHDFVYYSKV